MQETDYSLTDVRPAAFTATTLRSRESVEDLQAQSSGQFPMAAWLSVHFDPKGI
jgi:hypothetical protein